MCLTLSQALLRRDCQGVVAVPPAHPARKWPAASGLQGPHSPALRFRSSWWPGDRTTSARMRQARLRCPLQIPTGNPGYFSFLFNVALESSGLNLVSCALGFKVQRTLCGGQACQARFAPGSKCVTDPPPPQSQLLMGAPGTCVTVRPGPNPRGTGGHGLRGSALPGWGARLWTAPTRPKSRARPGVPAPPLCARLPRPRPRGGPVGRPPGSGPGPPPNPAAPPRLHSDHPGSHLGAGSPRGRTISGWAGGGAGPVQGRGERRRRGAGPAHRPGSSRPPGSARRAAARPRPLQSSAPAQPGPAPLPTPAGPSPRRGHLEPPGAAAAAG